MTDQGTIDVTAHYSRDARQPYVEIEMERLKAPLQISPAEARELALCLLGAAEAAEQDAFIFEFHSQRAGEDAKAGEEMLAEYRKWRDAHGLIGRAGEPDEARLRRMAQNLLDFHEKYGAQEFARHFGTKDLSSAEFLEFLQDFLREEDTHKPSGVGK